MPVANLHWLRRDNRRATFSYHIRFFFILSFFLHCFNKKKRNINTHTPNKTFIMGLLFSKLWSLFGNEGTYIEYWFWNAQPFSNDIYLNVSRANLISRTFVLATHFRHKNVTTHMKLLLFQTFERWRTFDPFYDIKHIFYSYVQSIYLNSKEEERKKAEEEDICNSFVIHNVKHVLTIWNKMFMEFLRSQIWFQLHSMLLLV